MRTHIRRALVPAALLSAVLLTGCSSGGDDKAAPTKTFVDDTQERSTVKASPSAPPSPSSSQKAVLSVGQTGTYEVGETDENGENYKATGKMSVTFVGAKYVTPAEIDTSNKPQHGQYVEVTLTFKNIGQSPARVETYGNLMWDDSSSAAQDATTLEGVGGGDDVDTDYKPGQGVTGKVVLDVGKRGGFVYYMFSEDPEGGTPFVLKLPA
ncbi:DUF4352 domain-containing protein [Streptomyces diastatochromogenes]|uniref:DUF4352 domain-containing protein n=1 Tax=Streptomyces diastatochromogenes TaxID=42236 RepID=UPI003646494A